MAKNEFNFEQAMVALNNADDLISVFLDFFTEERPLYEVSDTADARLFVQRCEPYESVILAVWEKVRKVCADMEHFISAKKGGEAT